MRYSVLIGRLLVFWHQDLQRWVCIGPEITGGYTGRSVWEAVGNFVACTSASFRSCVTTYVPKGGPEPEGPFASHVNGSEIPKDARDALDGII